MRAIISTGEIEKRNSTVSVLSSPVIEEPLRKSASYDPVPNGSPLFDAVSSRAAHGGRKKAQLTRPARNSSEPVSLPFPPVGSKPRLCSGSGLEAVNPNFPLTVK
ncbi:hypothetical protein E2C01_059837 [Portunus trituberculatus]|uniref:Uncharacterized protein n=1 Tax=Portunus trituberculatus TaxID=210409 RepID=A0A5B7H0M4_PORTR|nr:hypothetical protein [Portunus trituberculatus]